MQKSPQPVQYVRNTILKNVRNWNSPETNFGCLYPGYIYGNTCRTPMVKDVSYVKFYYFTKHRRELRTPTGLWVMWFL